MKVIVKQNEVVIKYDIFDKIKIDEAIKYYQKKGYEIVKRFDGEIKLEKL